MRAPSDLADLIRRHFPALDPRRVEALPHVGWGGDSDAVLVDGALVFRFPRSEEVARGLAVEVCLLPDLAERAPLPIPRFRYVARDGATGAPLFVGYPLIPGVPLTAARFAALAGDPAAVARAAAGLGGFLAALHRFPVARARACGVPAPGQPTREEVAARHAALRERVYPVLARDERAYLDCLFAAYLGDPAHFGWPPAVCHGDLTSDHILAADESALTGIIDFGDLRIGDPAGDFVWRFEYGDAFFRRVLAHYAAPVGDLDAFARVVGFRWRLMGVSQLGYGLAIGSAADVEEGRAALRARMRDYPV